jgi:hypothetical protein
MTIDHGRARIEDARTIAAELAGLIAGEGRHGLVWQQRLQQVAANLSVTDATDDEVLAAARERFDSMYAGGRNFSDFYLDRDDPAERVAANERFSALVQQLRDLLHGE